MNTNQATATPFVDFKHVKANVGIVQVLEHYGLMDALKQTGDRLSGPCPIHNGTNPTSFRVSISKNCFNCFGSCGRGGNVIDFVALKEGVEFRDAALLLQKWFLGNPEPSPPKRRQRRQAKEPEPAAAICRDQPDSGAVATVEKEEETGVNPPLTFALKTLKTDHPYLSERNLDPETVEHFGIGYCPRGILRGHIAIPIHNPTGELVGYAGRWPGRPPEMQPKYKLPKGFLKSVEVFNLHRALQEPDDLPLVIVEGFFDCFALWQAGISKCIALMGCSLSEAQEKLIADSMPEGGTIELLLDNDEAGRAATEEIAARLLRYALVRSVPLPDDVRQPDELSPDEIAEVFE